MASVVVDSYTKVKEVIELQQTDSDIFSDYYWSMINCLKALFHKWPSDLAKKLETQLVMRAVTESNLSMLSTLVSRLPNPSLILTSPMKPFDTIVKRSTRWIKYS